MPDLTIAETVLATIVAAMTGGAGIAAARGRRPPPGTPEDHELRITELERVLGRLTVLEQRMSTHESVMGAAAASLKESNERVWRAVESMNDKLDRMIETVIRVDVETTVERDLRRSTPWPALPALPKKEPPP